MSEMHIDCRAMTNPQKEGTGTMNQYTSLHLLT